MLEVQKSYFEKYWLKGKGREIRKKNLLCADVKHWAKRALHRGKFYDHYFTDEKNENHTLYKTLEVTLIGKR